MPSGSHGGSPGSHRSGGARSGGGSFGSSRSSRVGSGPSISRGPSPSHHNAPRHYGGGFGGGFHRRPMFRPFRMHFGPRVYVFGSKAFLFLPFILFMIMFIIMSSVRVSISESYIDNIKVDYVYYHQMILDAENNPDFMKDGIVTDKFYNDEVGRWYYYYEIEIEGSTNPLEGYTYSIYTNEQISQIRVGDVIKIAVNKANVDHLTDSVPIDFKNFDYKDDGDYIVASKTLSRWTAIKVVCWMVEIALIVGLVVYMVKTKKREDLETSETKAEEKEKRELEKQTLQKDLDWRCEYCANLNKASKTKCDNCGAGRR